MSTSRDHADRAARAAAVRAAAVRATAALLVALCVSLAGGQAKAGERRCDQGGDEACSFGIRQIQMSAPPALFNFQARISQAKLPVGDMASVFVVVKLLRGREVLCVEQIEGVAVIDSILNLTIGQNMSCRLDEAMAQNPHLAIQICLGGSSNCLKPVALGGVPYAAKVGYAGMAQRTYQAEQAGQANYARRATADRDMLIRKSIGAGYFSFETPTPNVASNLYSQDAFKRLQYGGFIQWVAFRDQTAQAIHILAKNAWTDTLELLEELVLAAKMTEAQHVVVAPADGGGAQAHAVTVIAGGMAVDGDTVFSDNLSLLGQTHLKGVLDISGPTEIQGRLTIDGSSSVTGGGMVVSGDSVVDGSLAVTGPVEVQSGGLVANAGVTVEGLLTAPTLTTSATLTVDGQSTVAALNTGQLTATALTLAALEGAGQATVGGALIANQNVTIDGPVIFHDHVVFEGGAGAPGNGLNPLYIAASGEDRALTLGGPQRISGTVTVGAGLDLAGAELVNTLYEVADSAPFVCDAAHQGAFYVDTATEALVYCLDTSFHAVGESDCGNGRVQPWEGCDDGGTANGDGCSAVCTVEPHWFCPSFGTQPTTGCVVVPVGCGDGQRAATEACDDGNNDPKDGCAHDCTVESGWACSGALGDVSVCTGETCGNGHREGAEACDDGNLAPGDGCGADCTVESGWRCNAQGDCWACSAESGGHCYLVETYRRSWQGARDDCATRGGYLARIDNASEEQVIVGAGCAGTLTCWIGASDAAQEGDYVWIAEAGGDAVGYVDWYAGQPTGVGQNCAAVDEDGWWDRACELANGYVCEIP